MTARERLHRLAVWTAVLACVVFVASIPGSVRVQPVVREAPDPLPAAEEERTGALEVGVFEAGDAGKPVAGARVRVFWEHEERYFQAAVETTDAEGRVVVRQLPRGAAWVIGEAPGHARTSTHVVIGDAPRAVRLELRPSHTLRVTVRDEQGAPLPEATVLVTGSDVLPHGALTDAAGAAAIGRLGRPPWTVKASAPGYESASQSGVDDDLTLTLRRPGWLEVKVEDAAGAAVGGAEVLIAGTGLWPARRTRTDDGGKVRISELPGGAYDLRASHGSRISQTTLGLELERGERKRVTLVLAPGRMITVLATDGEGDSPVVVPRADVVLVEEGLSPFPLQGRTNRMGKVTLGPIPPGHAVVAVRADGFVPRAAVPVPEEPPDPLPVALLRGGRLRGEVVDARGRPVDAATIEVIGTDLDGQPIAETPMLMAFRRSHFEWGLGGPAPLIAAGELGVMPGPVPPIPGAGTQVASLSSLSSFAPTEPDSSVEPWVTRFDGTFTAEPVPPGRVRALVRHPAYVEAVSQAVRLAPGGEAKVRVTLYAGGAIEGRLFGDRGIPVAGARVDVAASQGTLARTTLTATDGTFAFAALPEEVVLSVARPADLSKIVLRRPVRVPEGRTTDLELELPAEREAVLVRVRAGRAEPASGAQVTVLSLDPEVPLRTTEFTGEDGTVSVADARGLALRVQVEAAGFARAALEVQSAPDEIQVDLQPGVTVEGAVTAVRGRQAVEGAEVLLVSGGRREPAWTDAAGRYRFDGVTPGPARIVVRHAGHAPEELEVVVEPTGRAGRPLEVPPVDLKEPGRIAGRVVDAEGRPVSGARVALDVAPAYVPSGALPEGVVLTDAGGSFELAGLRPGPATVAAYAADVGRGTARAEVSAGEDTREVVVVLSAPAEGDEPASAGGVAVTLGERRARGLQVVVVHVAPRSEAEHSGLEPGDVIATIDGVAPRSMEDARKRLSGPAGTDVVIGLRRGDRESTLRVTRERVQR